MICCCHHYHHHHHQQQQQHCCCYCCNIIIILLLFIIIILILFAYQLGLRFVYPLSVFDFHSHCRAQILSAVDNYGILCLDIVWCYFWLKSILDLPNAEEKLQKCKECFQRSYGQNMERLTFVRVCWHVTEGLIFRLSLTLLLFPS